MQPQRNQVGPGLALTVRNYRAVLWVYVFNLGLALLFSLRNYSQWNDVLGHSLASQRMTSSFDLGTALATLMRVGQGAPSNGVSSYLGLPVYVLLYFLIVPGALFCYQTEAPATLSTLLSHGLKHCWRFLRITLLAGVVAFIVLGPLFALNTVFERRLDARNVGESAFLREAAAMILIILVGSVIRLYFDLVEVYTVQLGLQVTPDYRIRRALLPALRMLFRGFTANMIVFLFLTIVGSGFMVAASRFAVDSLAQPRVWPSFLVTQAGLLVMLFTRFWQRGAQTALAQHYPIATTLPELAGPGGSDPLPPQEPIAPALDGPDPGVFHHDPHGLPQQ